MKFADDMEGEGIICTEEKIGALLEEMDNGVDKWSGLSNYEMENHGGVIART